MQTWRQISWYYPIRVENKLKYESEASLHELWDTINWKETHIMGVSEGEEWEKKRTENLFKEIMSEKLSNLGKYYTIQVQEAQRSPNRFNSKRSLTIYSIIKLKNQRQNSESSKRRKTYHVQGSPNKIIGRFLSRNLAEQERMEWYIQSAQRKKKNYQPRILYEAKLSLRNEVREKTSPDKQKLRKIIILRSVLQEM